ncbi:hypothetical protein BJ973_003905 [Actinoplanes tereljensis]|uniref:DUF4333 domain-containing protein n=1 Tax=Paractinoplanes tereljensis TaxID=571912 RepID=A0A919TZ81_9ACTN|nr:hypothetical protein [Actinoplanes tereljensis]GIF25627.1 hypothetical protein Ate02nite_83570 [Actinoplanes tereljensis]
MTSRPRTMPKLALILAVAVLSGCSGAAPETKHSAPEGNPAAPEASSGIAGCDDAAATVQKHLTSSDVRTVTVNGQCTNVTVDTGLGDDDTVGGRRICETAAEVAYTGDINSVTVLSGSGAELSVGIPGMKCLP